MIGCFLYSARSLPLFSGVTGPRYLHPGTTRGPPLRAGSANGLVMWPITLVSTGAALE